VYALQTFGFTAGLLAGYGEDDAPVMKAFRERVMALGASGLVFSLEHQVIADAQREADEKAMDTLVQQRKQLERRIDELRMFEREYRSRLLAWLEEQMADLRAGAADTGESPAQVDGGQ
jgi:hypothetical protein